MPPLRKNTVISREEWSSGEGVAFPVGTTQPPPFTTTTTLPYGPRQQSLSSACHYSQPPETPKIKIYDDTDLMASRPLGLGSRSSKQRAPIELNAPSLRPTRSQASTTTHGTTTSTHISTHQISTSASQLRRHQQQTSQAVARRGIGLFESDLETDRESEPEHKKKALPPTTPVKFSGDTSGFAGLRTESLSVPPTPASGSRKSAHTTPSRSKSIRNRRQTPYTRKTSTTAAALQRAGHSPTTDDEDLTIGETMEMRGSEAVQKRGDKRRGAKFAMHGTRDVEMDDGESKQKGRGKKAAVANNAPMNRTWGQWLRSIVPNSIKKPFGFGAEQQQEPESLEKPEQRESSEEREDFTTGIPGSFDEKMQRLAVTSPKSKQFTETHIPDSKGLFTYEKKQPKETSMALTPVRRGASVRVISPPASLRKSSNFLERMKTGKSSTRYGPYPRASRSITPQAVSPTEVEQPEELYDMSPEEALEQLKQRKRARKVQEAEDRYARRQLMARLGREGELSDSDSEVERKRKVQRQGRMKDIATSPIKQARRTITTGAGEDADMDDGSTTPPSTPPKIGGGGLFGNALYSKPPPVLGYGTSTSTSTGTGPDDADKENNLSGPPPPPSPSHRQLPDPSSNFSAPSIPPAPSQLFPEKPQPVGGFGISDPAPAPPSALARFDKHKPRVSSSLRNEASAANKEADEAAKENATPGASTTTTAPNPFAKSSKAPFGSSTMTSTSSGSTQTTSTSAGGIFGSGGALREVESNAFMGPGDKPVKIDMRAKIAAVSFSHCSKLRDVDIDCVKQMPVQNLSVLFQWPTVEVFQASIKDEVTKMWKADDAIMKAFMKDFSSVVRAQ